MDGAETSVCHEHIIDILRIQNVVMDVVFSRFIKHGFRKKVGLALVFQILLEMYIHFAGFHYNRIGELSLVPGIIKGENIISHQASRLPFADQVRHPFKTKPGCSWNTEESRVGTECGSKYRYWRT